MTMYTVNAFSLAGIIFIKTCDKHGYRQYVVTCTHFLVFHGCNSVRISEGIALCSCVYLPCSQSYPEWFEMGSAVLL